MLYTSNFSLLVLPPTSTSASLVTGLDRGQKITSYIAVWLRIFLSGPKASRKPPDIVNSMNYRVQHYDSSSLFFT